MILLKIFFNEWFPLKDFFECVEEFSSDVSFDIAAIYGGRIIPCNISMPCFLRTFDDFSRIVVATFTEGFLVDDATLLEHSMFDNMDRDRDVFQDGWRVVVVRLCGHRVGCYWAPCVCRRHHLLPIKLRNQASFVLCKQ